MGGDARITTGTGCVAYRERRRWGVYVCVCVGEIKPCASKLEYMNQPAASFLKDRTHFHDY